MFFFFKSMRCDEGSRAAALPLQSTTMSKRRYSLAVTIILWKVRFWSQKQGGLPPRCSFVARVLLPGLLQTIMIILFKTHQCKHQMRLYNPFVPLQIWDFLRYIGPKPGLLLEFFSPHEDNCPYQVNRLFKVAFHSLIKWHVVRKENGQTAVCE